MASKLDLEMSDVDSKDYTDSESSGPFDDGYRDSTWRTYPTGLSEEPARGFAILSGLRALVLVACLVLSLMGAFRAGQFSSTSAGNLHMDTASCSSNGIIPHSLETASALPGIDHKSQVPSSTKVVALVFFGRRLYVDLLDCYLRQNLKVNGGLLDEVCGADVLSCGLKQSADLAVRVPGPLRSAHV